MSQRDDNWGPENEDVIRRLRAEKAELNAFELDRVKTTVMGRVKPSASRSRSTGRFRILALVRSRLVVAALTLGLMAAGTAGAVASSSSGPTTAAVTGAAQSQYRPHHCIFFHHYFLCECFKGHIVACIIASKIPPYAVADNSVGLADKTSR
jgi:hypothetical protein